MTTAVAADDADTTYIDTSLGLNQQFSVANTAIASTDTICYVSVSGSFRKTSSTFATVKAYITDGTTTLYGPQTEITSQSYATFAWDFTTVALANAGWTVTDLNALEVGLLAVGSNIRCTYLVCIPTYYTTPVFRFAEPENWEDAVNGKYCAMTGMWAPASHFEGGYIAEYAPHDRTRGIVHRRPRTGKTLGG